MDITVDQATSDAHRRILVLVIGRSHLVASQNEFQIRRIHAKRNVMLQVPPSLAVILLQDKVSHTKGICEDQDIGLYTWGPFLGDMSEKVARNIREGIPTILVAGGSAAGYLIDALQQQKAYPQSRLKILYTTADEGLFEWMQHVISLITQKSNTDNVKITLAFTGTETNVVQNDAKQHNRQLEQKSSSTESESENAHLQTPISSKGVISLQYCRINFGKQLRDDVVTFFQGSGGLQKAVKAACREMKNNRFVAGPIYDQSDKKKESILSFLHRKIHTTRAEII